MLLDLIAPLVPLGTALSFHTSNSRPCLLGVWYPRISFPERDWSCPAVEYCMQKVTAYFKRVAADSCVSED